MTNTANCSSCSNVTCTNKLTSATHLLSRAISHIAVNGDSPSSNGAIRLLVLAGSAVLAERRAQEVAA